MQPPGNLRYVQLDVIIFDILNLQIIDFDSKSFNCLDIDLVQLYVIYLVGHFQILVLSDSGRF